MPLWNHCEIFAENLVSFAMVLKGALTAMTATAGNKKYINICIGDIAIIAFYKIIKTIATVIITIIIIVIIIIIIIVKVRTDYFSSFRQLLSDQVFWRCRCRQGQLQFFQHNIVFFF